MRIYMVHLDYDHYASCNVNREACYLEIPEAKGLETWEMSLMFEGEAKDNWWPRIMELCEEDKGGFKPVGDFSSPLGLGEWILERNAFKKLENVLENVQVLPVICPFGDYVAINILTVLDAVDYEKSKYTTFGEPREDGSLRILTIEEHVFKKQVVANHKIFKIREDKRGKPFVNEEFVREVEKHGITGFRFELVWEG